MTALHLGLLSTANINRQILGGAAATSRVEVVAVGSRDGAKAKAYAGEHGIPQAHGSYEALLEDTEVDAIYIGLPNGMHHEWTMRALAAGKHVLCEKPYTRRPEEAVEAFDAADAAGLVLTEAFMYRHHPQAKTIARLVADGAVGRLLAVKATFSFALTDLTNVRAIPELDGGALMDVGCYCVSGSRLVAGEPLSVLAEQVVGETGIDMALYGTLRFPGDVVAQIEASFLAPRATGTRGRRRRGRAARRRPLAGRLGRRSRPRARRLVGGRAGRGRRTPTRSSSRTSRRRSPVRRRLCWVATTRSGRRA